ncbi:hypothetical protein ES703_112857 [subsurface metagenome]
MESYEQLRKEPSGFLCGKENKELFIMAMIYGFLNKSRLKLDKKEGFVREEYLNDEYRTVIKALAIKEEGGLEVLLDLQKVYSIAEEYAAGGISYLKSDVLSKKHGHYDKKLEELLVELHDKIS